MVQFGLGPPVERWGYGGGEWQEELVDGVGNGWWWLFAKRYPGDLLQVAWLRQYDWIMGEDGMWTKHWSWWWADFSLASESGTTASISHCRGGHVEGNYGEWKQWLHGPASASAA